MNDKFEMRMPSKEEFDANFRNFVESAKRVMQRRKVEVEAVLGPIPTFKECDAALRADPEYAKLESTFKAQKAK